MASVKIVTNKKGTVLRNMDMKQCSTDCVNKVVSTLESIICEERDIIHLEVDYTGCDDSKTIEGNT